jgi:hypothetical protein
MNFPKDLQNDLKFNNKKPYIIVLNSTTKNSGGSNTFATYAFDWNVIPDQLYNVYFQFVATDHSTYAAANIPAAQIVIEFGQSTNTFATVANRQCANTTTYLGSLRKAVSSGNNFYLYANKTDNPPIYITGGSNNNNFLVAILNDQGLGYDNSSLASYILTLYFEPA